MGRGRGIKAVTITQPDYCIQWEVHSHRTDSGVPSQWHCDAARTPGRTRKSVWRTRLSRSHKVTQQSSWRSRRRWQQLERPVISAVKYNITQLRWNLLQIWSFLYEKLLNVMFIHVSRFKLVMYISILLSIYWLLIRVKFGTLISEQPTAL